MLCRQVNDEPVLEADDFAGVGTSAGGVSASWG